MIVDHDNERVLEVLPDREKSTVLAYLRQNKRGLLAQVQEVTCDMWDGYVNAAREAFGEQVTVTIDRFHVMKNFQECLSKARRELQKTLPEEQAKQLKGMRWLLLTNPENLPPEARERLRQCEEKFPRLKELTEQRAALRAIFEDRSIATPAQGRRRLQGWLERVQALGIKPLQKFCNTVTNWMDKIANYFRSRGSNGRTEGLNHGLRALLWRAYGMANFENFRLRVLHCFGLQRS